MSRKIPSNRPVSASETMIKALKLKIALLKRDKYGRSPERTARLLDQLEIQLEVTCPRFQGHS